VIYVVARDSEHGERFLGRHSQLSDDITVLLGQDSYFSLLNNLIATCVDDIALVVHDDVTLPMSFRQRFDELLSRLGSEWPNWGVVGNAGVSPMQVGLAVSKTVRFLADPHGGSNLSTHIVPAWSIDGNVMMLNIRELRARGVDLPELGGFQLYDIALSIETLRAGLAVLIAPELACYHSSKGSQSAFDEASRSPAIREYLASRVVNSILDSLNGPIDLRKITSQYRNLSRVEVVIDSLRNAQKGRPKSSIEVVTRSQFQRPALLSRSATTIRSFSRNAVHAIVRHSVVSGVDDSPSTAADGVRVLRRPREHGQVDDRFHLVRFAAREVESDYIWFVDDDDWVFPNGAELISLVVSLAPKGSTVFLDTRHFFEDMGDDFSAVPPVSARVGRVFKGDQFMGCLSGYNWVPFCGAILPRARVAELPDELVSRIVYYEDFATILHTMADPKFFPVVPGVLGAGISIHGHGQSVVEDDRADWNQSMSELGSLVAHGLVGPVLLSLPRLAISIPAAELHYVERNLRLAQVAHDNAIEVIEAMQSSLSWRLTRPFRLIGRLSRQLLRRPSSSQ